MSNPQFRNRSIMVSTPVFEALKAIADIEGHDCPDTLADLELAKACSLRFDIEWLRAERRKALEEVKKRYQARCKAQPEDQLP
jgi:hypothetical protein